MEIHYEVKDTDGKSIEGSIQNTIHQLGELAVR
jgi:hypothetical protein